MSRLTDGKRRRKAKPKILKPDFCEYVERDLQKLDRNKLKSNYLEYWIKIVPTSDAERRSRWIFAILAAHSSWEQTCAAYSQVMQQGLDNAWDIELALRKVRYGRYSVMPQILRNFDQVIKIDPALLLGPTSIDNHYDWRSYRDRLAITIPGAGLKTSSFALEMCFPEKGKVVAVDTHLYQWYGFTAKDGNDELYRQIEDHWIETCEIYALNPTMARHALWDIKAQGKTGGTAYWSYVFENGKTAAT